MYIHIKWTRYNMSTTIQKWGNSLGVRLPKELVNKIKLRSGSLVTLTSKDEGILISPTDMFRHKTLKELLKGVTKRNRHKLVDWGGPIGKEIW